MEKIVAVLTFSCATIHVSSVRVRGWRLGASVHPFLDNRERAAAGKDARAFPEIDSKTIV
jgi:hypothetical protein